AIRDSQLASVILALVLVDVIILVTWELVDPYHMQVVDAKIEETKRGVIYRYQVCNCVSDKSIYFTVALYITQGLIITFGAFLAWETRKVKIEALNDSKLIGMCIYNVVIMTTMGVAINYVMANQKEYAYGFSSGFIIVGTTLIQLIVFLPKVYTVARNSDKVEPMGTTNASKIDTVTSVSKRS
ncbi:hypothetical protein CAPTEDRAFT_211745, partial [Capitella teleta]